MSLSPTANDLAERFRTLEADTRRELDHTREQLTEIQLLLQQSSNEAEKLSQREAAITSRVRDMEINLENYTRADIKTVYTSSHEVGLRLFMMHSQVEQLQMRQEHVKEYQKQLGTILSLLNTIGATPVETKPEKTESATASAQKPGTGSLSRVIEAQESERQRVSRYLHDGTAQTLTNLVLKAEICEHMVDRDTAEAKAELQALRASLTAGLQETRRLIFQLRPMILDDIGLVSTLRRYLGEVGRAGRFNHTVRGPESNDQLAPHIRSLLFRLVQEVVAGLASQGALEQVTVDLNTQGTRLELSIEARAAADAPPPALEEVLNEEHIAQRLYMLGATTEIVAIGERGTQMVVSAVPPAA